MRKTHSIRSRRRGQALLLAVLVMILTALLGSTFLVIVAANLNQTAREEEKQAAINAAQVGLSSVNEQMVASRMGENWRPEQLAPPPAPDSVGGSYSQYYSELDRAQGWARQIPEAKNSDAETGNAALALPVVTGGDYNGDNKFSLPDDDWAKLEYYKSLDENTRVFVKFPDPRQPIPANAPRYMAEVTFLNDNNTRPEEKADKVGMLRITIIGQTEGDRAWEQRVNYKGTSKRGGPLSFARFDANADPATGKPVESLVEKSTSGATIEVADASAFRPGHLVLISNSDPAITPRRAIVQSTNVSSTPDTLTVKDTVLVAEGETVRVASPLIDGIQSIDANGYQLTPTAKEKPEAPVRMASAAPVAGETPVPVGAQFNGGLSLEGPSTIQIDSTRKDFVRVAGDIFNHDKNGTGDNRLAKVQDVATGAAPLPILRTGETATTAVQKLIFGGNTQNSDPTQAKQAEAVEPAAVNLNRYRELTRDAAPDGALGYGPGLYIDNAQDVEKVLSGGKLQKLSPDQLHRLLQRKSFKMKSGGGNIVYNANMAANASIVTGAEAFRLAWPRVNVDTYQFPRAGTGLSLEEKGVRGWVNPWEYLPRGVNVELNNTKIIVHRDSRSDSLPVDTNKSWKKNDGATFASPLGDRIYRMELTGNAESVTRTFGAQNADPDPRIVPALFSSQKLDKPFNGVIFAEGNIRIRGSFASSLTEDLVVVSGGNIFVEGSLRRSDGKPGHIALIARGSVIYNPTQMLTRLDCIADRDIADSIPTTEVQDPTTTVRTNVAAGNTTLPIANVSLFRVGDFIYLPQAEGGSTDNRFQVVGIQSGPSLRVSRPLPAINIATDNRVFLLSEPKVTTDTTTGEYFRLLKLRQDVLLRQVNFDGINTTTTAYVAARMAGERRQGMFLERQTDASPKGITVSADNNNNGIIEPAERFLKSQMPGTPPGTPDREKQIDENLIGRTLGVFAQDFANYDGGGDSGGGDDGGDDGDDGGGDDSDDDAPRYYPHWLVGNSDSKIDSQKATLQARFLAMIGNRNGSYPQGAAVAPNYSDARLEKDQGYSIPLMTSVNFTRIDSTTSPTMFVPTQQGVIGARATAAPANARDLEIADFLNETFYQTASAAVFPENAPPAPANPEYPNYQARLRGVALPLSAPGVAATNPNVSYFELRPNIDILPALRVADLKLELENGPVTHPGNWWNQSADFTYKALPVQIDATIVAQSGSWFVVPTPMNQGFDINGNSVVEANEQTTGTRFRRPNYAITVRGTMSQAFSATGVEDYDNEADPDGQAVGAMAKWLDTSSYPTKLSATNGYSARGGTWQTIRYEYAPLSNGAASFAPVAPGLIYQG